MQEVAGSSPAATTIHPARCRATAPQEGRFEAALRRFEPLGSQINCRLPSDIPFGDGSWRPKMVDHYTYRITCQRPVGEIVSMSPDRQMALETMEGTI